MELQGSTFQLIREFMGAGSEKGNTQYRSNDQYVNHISKQVEWSWIQTEIYNINHNYCFKEKIYMN